MITDNSENGPKYHLDEWVKGMVKLYPSAKTIAAFAKFAKHPVLDIGCAYGVPSLEALKTGAKVIACDIEQEHLTVLQK